MSKTKAYSIPKANSFLVILFQFEVTIMYAYPSVKTVLGFGTRTLHCS